jgi:hypothetical protein
MRNYLDYSFGYAPFVPSFQKNGVRNLCKAHDARVSSRGSVYRLRNVFRAFLKHSKTTSSMVHKQIRKVIKRPSFTTLNVDVYFTRYSRRYVDNTTQQKRNETYIDSNRTGKKVPEFFLYCRGKMWPLLRLTYHTYRALRLRDLFTVPHSWNFPRILQPQLERNY